MNVIRLLYIRAENSALVSTLARVLADLYIALYEHVQRGMQSASVSRLYKYVLFYFERYYPTLSRQTKITLDKAQAEYNRLYVISEREVARKFDLDENGTEWFFGIALGVGLAFIASFFAILSSF